MHPDEELRNREEKDYLNRIESKAANYSLEKFHDKRHAFGTIIQASLFMKPGPTTKRADRCFGVGRECYHPSVKNMTTLVYLID